MIKLIELSHYNVDDHHMNSTTIEKYIVIVQSLCAIDYYEFDVNDLTPIQRDLFYNYMWNCTVKQLEQFLYDDFGIRINHVYTHHKKVSTRWVINRSVKQ